MTKGGEEKKDLKMGFLEYQNTGVRAVPYSYYYTYIYKVIIMSYLTTPAYREYLYTPFPFNFFI
jgi:hypothetical protein